MYTCWSHNIVLGILDLDVSCGIIYESRNSEIKIGIPNYDGAYIKWTIIQPQTVYLEEFWWNVYDVRLSQSKT